MASGFCVQIFPHFSKKKKKQKKTFCCWLSTGLAHAETIIHLCVCEEGWIFPSLLRNSANIHHYSLALQ